MDGRIVASNGPEGARFEVWLPVVDEPEIVEPEAPAARSDRTNQKTFAS
jgi:hypothetical protein